MVAEKATYEECRKKRLEENNRRMEELNIHKLSSCLKKSLPPKTSPMKKVKPRLTKVPIALNPVRRSSRVADKPQPNYNETTVDLFERSSRIYKRRDLLNRKYASDDDRMDAIRKANDLELGLDSEYPSFVKPMLQSHVTGGFWLGLPVKFCKTYLPTHDEAITLVDEDGNESETKYLAGKTGLSGGWRGFSLDHQLVDGDALVFQLIKPTVFKVYIIRADSVVESNEDEDDVNDKSDRPAKTRSGQAKGSRTRPTTSAAGSPAA